MDKLIKKYDKAYTALQKHLSSKLLEEKDERKIAIIRQQRAKLSETYEQTIRLLKETVKRAEIQLSNLT